MKLKRAVLTLMMASLAVFGAGCGDDGGDTEEAPAEETGAVDTAVEDTMVEDTGTG